MNTYRTGIIVALLGSVLFVGADAESLVNLQESQRQAMRQSVLAGEQDRLDLDAVDVQRSISARARLDALAHAQKSLGDLEDAVQRPLAAGDELAIDPDSPALSKRR
ncbi:MAG: hypothetical protein ACLP2F_06050 [Steroidobacteraceae bacterium]